MALSPVKHIPVIDSLRGAAAMMVCLFHFTVPNNLFEQEAVLSFFSWGRYGVQVFFVISGTVIILSLLKSQYRLQNFWRFLFKRLIRIEPPYLVSLLLAVAYMHARELVPGATPVDLEPSIEEVLLHLGYLVSFFDDVRWVNPVYWTLAIEFQFYLFMGLLGPVLLSGRVGRWIILAVGLAIPVLVPELGHLFSWLPLFYLGIAVALKYAGKMQTREFFLTMLACCLSVAFSIGLPDLLIGVATASVILFFGDFESAVGRFLGRISYSLYLLHAISGAVLINLAAKYTDAILLRALLLLIGLVFSIAVSYLFYKGIEKPALLSSKRVREQPAREATQV